MFFGEKSSKKPARMKVSLQTTDSVASARTKRAADRAAKNRLAAVVHGAAWTKARWGIPSKDVTAGRGAFIFGGKVFPQKSVSPPETA